MSALAKQARILEAVTSGACDEAARPVTSIIDGRDLVAALQIMVADHKAAAARNALCIADDKKADILDLTAMESAARARVVLARLGIDANTVAEALL